ncbi:MAG: hypothetical protein ACU84Q_19155 [Gammaproteobacteria bacterium]
MMINEFKSLKKYRKTMRYGLAFLTSMVALLTNVSAEESGDSEIQFSEAETLVWMTNQLDDITQPMTLHYTFTKRGTFEKGFEDVVEFNIEKIHDDGMKSASLKFFTGERNFKVPPVEKTDVNPILKVYLQGDVYEMNRLTDPDGASRERWRYFQRRIKFALADGANIEDVKIDFNGQQYAARKVTFRPYANDPKRNLFEQFAGKEYEIIVSDDLPGYVYKIRTVIPGKEGELPLIEEELLLSRAEPTAG